MKYTKLGILSLAVFVFFVTSASANVDHLKTYRKVFPDFKPNCAYCHIDEKPKKEDGKHDLNAYGAKLREIMGEEELTEEMVQSVGNHEDFETQKDNHD